ncbi:hypothetical protein [Mariniflexile sp. AS56]|uniref:hypothetical protein n=1 Tax=Mariniflexile sp. AS56 TaxID=3063957 RepID=UPI0026F1FF1C|nr:hypothetical protein [Mariniflexile sp. AS56]MDO7170788.1 hypothetical protein [Mariniflexile sp. AS56]
MKVFVLAVLFCIGIYFLTKASPKPSMTEVSNIGKQQCAPPNTGKTNSGYHEGCCIILDRTSVILKQNSRYEAQH